MVKYNETFKMKLVSEYLEGPLGYDRLAQKYNMPHPSPIKCWVKAYKAQGRAGLARKVTQTVYSVQFKLNTVQFMLNTGATYSETAVQFNLTHPSMIIRWMKDFQ